MPDASGAAAPNRERIREHGGERKVADESGFGVVDPQLSVAAAHLMRWANGERETGAESLRLCMMMVSVGSSIAAGPNRSFDWRSGWADWLRAIADDIEAGRPVGPFGCDEQ